MKAKRILCLLLLLLLCPALSGCRVRTAVQGPASGTPPETGAAGIAADPSDLSDEQKKNEEAGGQTKENPESSRKEYDETAPAEIVPGTERTLHVQGEGTGAPHPSESADTAADQLSEGADRTATQTAAAQEAEQMGVSEDAEAADSAMTYFTVLLQDRMGSLYECQRLNLYWETAQDHVTVHKTSPEHSLILAAGAYDVSARLLPENLRVDDGWIGRKNPGMIVKIVNRSVLGSGVLSAGAARQAYAALLSRDGWAAIDAVRSGRVLLLSEELLETPPLRTAAALIIAKGSNPELFQDVDLNEALGMLTEKAAGFLPSGLFYYQEQGGTR